MPTAIQRRVRAQTMDGIVKVSQILSLLTLRIVVCSQKTALHLIYSFSCDLRRIFEAKARLCVLADHKCNKGEKTDFLVLLNYRIRVRGPRFCIHETLLHLGYISRLPVNVVIWAELAFCTIIFAWVDQFRWKY
jgi:hypothetical protein